MNWLQQPHNATTTKAYRNELSFVTIIIKSFTNFLLVQLLTELLSDFDVVPCDKHIKSYVFSNKNPKKKIKNSVYNKKME